MLAFSTIDTAPLLAKRDESYKGRATFYDPGLGSCGITNSPQDFIVALNIPQYTGNDVCNKVVLITGPKGSVKCTVTDKCPGCGFGCLDLSPAAFNQIGDQSAGVVDITWSYVDGNDKPQQPPESTKGQPTTSATSTTTSDSESSTSSTSETSSTTSTTDETSTPTSTSNVIKLTDVMNNFYNGTVVNYDSGTESYPSMALPSSSDISSSTSNPTSTPTSTPNPS